MAHRKKIFSLSISDVLTLLGYEEEITRSVSDKDRRAINRLFKNIKQSLPALEQAK